MKRDIKRRGGEKRRDERGGDKRCAVRAGAPKELSLQGLFGGKEGFALTEALEVVTPSGNKRVWIVLSEQAALPDTIV